MGVKWAEGFLSAFFLLPSTPSLSRLSSYFKKHGRKTHQTKRLLRRLNLVFRSSIDDGNKNVVIKKTSLFFKLCRNYSDSLKMSNVGEFSWD